MDIWSKLESDSNRCWFIGNDVFIFHLFRLLPMFLLFIAPFSCCSEFDTEPTVQSPLFYGDQIKKKIIWKENKTTVRWICYIPAISFRVPFQVHLQNVGSIISILIGSQVFGFRIPALEKFTAELNRSKIVKVSSFIAIFGRFQTNALSYFWPSRWLLFPTCFLIILSSLIQIWWGIKKKKKKLRKRRGNYSK